MVFDVKTSEPCLAAVALANSAVARLQCDPIVDKILWEMWACSCCAGKVGNHLERKPLTFEMVPDLPGVWAFVFT